MNRHTIRFHILILILLLPLLRIIPPPREQVLSIVPGLLTARLLQVGVNLSCRGSLNAAAEILCDILAKRPLFYDGYLIRARIDMEQVMLNDIPFGIYSPLHLR